MFKIEYYIIDEKVESVEMITEVSFRYNLFLGGVYFKMGVSTISMDWDWVPVLDMAICLNLIVKKMKNGFHEQEFDFTESDSKIFFMLNNDRVQISTSFTPEVFHPTITEFEIAVREFNNNVFKQIGNANHNLKRNPIILKYSKSVE